MYQRSLLRDEDVEPLGDAIVTVLEKLGAMYQNDAILDALDQAGALVDRATQTATFPREMTLEFLKTINLESRNQDGSDDGHTAFRAPSPGYWFHQLSPFVYDAVKKERRLGNRTDYIDLIKLCDTLHPDQGAGHCLLLADVPAFLEPLEVTLLQFKYAGRPRGGYVQDVGQIDYLREMEEVSGIEGLTWLANIGFSSPLRLGRDVSNILAYKVSHGGPANLYIMTVSGAGIPVTVAGSIVIAAAEFMANWMVGRSMNPDAKISAGAWIATMDMRASGEASYSAPDAQMRNFALREFMRRWTGMSIGVGSGEYTPAKVPGLVASLEKAHSAMTAAAFTGSHGGCGSGHLDGGLLISPVQLLLDREMALSLAHLESPIDASNDAIGLDSILDVGHASEGNYMGAMHTAEHFRRELWLPELLGRNGWEGAQTEEAIVSRAQAKVDELLASHQMPETDPDLLAKLRGVIDRAKKDA